MRLQERGVVLPAAGVRTAIWYALDVASVRTESGTIDGEVLRVVELIDRR